MLANQHFYNASIRKTLEIFGTLFSNIIIKRFDRDNLPIQEFKMPIVYSARDRLIARIQHVPDLTEHTNVGFTYPTMGFELTNIEYDPSRKLNTVQKIIDCSNGGNKSSFLPVPYNLTIELNIIATNTTDALQAVEQIVPYFTPTLSVSANLSNFGIPESPINLLFTLDDISFIDNYADNFADATREITYSLRFTAQTYIFGAIADNSTRVIKEVNVNINSGQALYFNNVDALGNINEGNWNPDLNHYNNSILMTDEKYYSGLQLDFSQYKTGTNNYTNGPVPIPVVDRSNTVTFTSTVPDGSTLGQVPVNTIYDLGKNGNIDSTPIFAGVDAGIGFCSEFVFTTPIQQFGLFFNYYPDNIDVTDEPTISTYDKNDVLLSIYYLKRNPKSIIETPNKTNIFLFRGIYENTGNVISKFRMNNAYMVAATKNWSLI